ncbi:hypothetical protein [Hoeflea poritis]|uniref:Signal peptidase n=1 Tax=Hoeflea poritis TaxID=2993659 RepID=A0ABT4VUE3_9HYPH|nr:hypothetical protein [Hoeflea poritis]MDA4848330.1 hypothetical protein [Hoeflea poritis]
MMNWLCALLLLVFSATVASAAQGPFTQSVAKASAFQEAAFINAGDAAAKPTTQCCPDAIAKSGSATPCSVDCSFLPASCDMNITGLGTGYGGTVSLLPDWLAGKAQFRPPIV